MGRTAGVAVLVLCLPVFVDAQGDGVKPAPKEHQSESGLWRVKVPADWTVDRLPADDRSLEAVKFLREGDRRLLLIVQVLRDTTHFDAVVEAVRGKFKEQKVTLDSDSQDPLDGRKAWRFERIIEAGGRPVRSGQVVVDGGARVLMLVYSGLDPLKEEERATLNSIVDSLRIKPEERQALAFEFESKDLGIEGLRLDLPKGGQLNRPTDDDFELVWKTPSAFFMLGWERTRETCAEKIEYEFKRVVPGEEDFGVPEIVSQTPVDIDGSSCVRLRMYVVSGGKRVMTMALLVRPSGEGELAMLGFVVGGEVPFEQLQPVEERLAKARIPAHFAAPLKSLPELSRSETVWLGRASVKVPQDWVAVRLKESRGSPDEPMVDQAEAWGAPGAADLRVAFECGTVKGGAEGYQKWMTRGKYKKRHNPSSTKPREITVGGRAGLAWETESGSEKDRWETSVVVVTQGGVYLEITARYPVALRNVYGPLAEKAAATVDWTK